jgi:twitching motility protein PilT
VDRSGTSVRRWRRIPGERFIVVALRKGGELWLEIRRARSSGPSPATRAIPAGVLAAPASLLTDDLAVPDAKALWPDGTGGHTFDSGAGNPPSGAGRMWSDLDEGDLARFDEGLPAVAAPLVADHPDAPGQVWSDLSEFELDKLDDPPQPSPSAVPHGALPVDVPTIGAGTAPDIHAVPPRQAAVLSLARTQNRTDEREPPADLTVGRLVRLMRVVAARGGSALYITSGARPTMRVDGEMRGLDGEEPLSAADTEALLVALMPASTREALGNDERKEWISDATELGRMRCVSFRDRRGAGGIFRMLTARPASAEQLGLSREAQALALEPEGLVLIAGPRSSGRSTVIAALVDLINRTRRELVITIESEISVVHESQGSMISQREVRGDPRGVLAAARSALREDPDVLVLDEYADDALTDLALEAAGSGRIVIAGLPARTAPEGVDRFIDHFAAERRQRAQVALAENLRGVIALSLPRKAGGGRLAAREVLLNTVAVAALIAEGRTGELPAAIEEGRKIGMVSLNESLAALVKSASIDVREAYRCAGDRQGLLALLKRNGVDTAPLERRA